MSDAIYTNPLSWSGQFAHCSLPLRLDSYRGCGFSCRYCFARARGGKSPGQKIIRAASPYIERAFERAGDGHPSVIAQALRRRIPIHFGGMSDPFQPAEQRHGVTFAYLRVLADRKYPTIISTKGTLPAESKYLSLLKTNPHTIVQISLISTVNKSALLVEPNATPPSRLLRVMEKLSKSGVIVTCRLQPYIPEIAGHIQKFVSTVAAAGAKQISIEHLKVPLEKVGNSFIENARSTYVKLGARRDGREYVLPATIKLEPVLALREACRKAGIYFDSADNEFQYLSDSWACCSGADLFPGFENYYRYQIGYAVRRSIGAEIRLSVLRNEWRPNGSIDRYLNSKTRLSSRDGLLGSAEQHIKYRWDALAAPGSPATYHGVVTTERRDKDGHKIYSWVS